jgi:hypothetical protein
VKTVTDQGVVVARQGQHRQAAERAERGPRRSGRAEPVKYRVY